MSASRYASSSSYISFHKPVFERSAKTYICCASANIPVSFIVKLFFTSVENPPPVQIIGKYFWIADKIVPACFIERTLEIGKVSRPSPRAT